MLNDLPDYGLGSDAPKDEPYLALPDWKIDNIDELNITEELAYQYSAARRQMMAIDMPEFMIATPMNQRAQILNTITAIIRQIVEMQERVMNVSRIQAMEAALIETLKTLPQEVQDQFFAKYKEALDEIGQ